MSKPFEVGDVVVYAPRHASSVPVMQQFARSIGDTFFDADAVMVVTDIRRVIKGTESQSGWMVALELEGAPGAGTMVEMDSDWFIKKGKETVRENNVE